MESKPEETNVADTSPKSDRSGWAIGGGLLIGLGVGFFFLKTSALAFVGSMLTGLGVGLMVASLIPRTR
jgi:hypothetical protein